MPREYTLKDIDFHVRRFQNAYNQTEKGPERKAELKKNLDYWMAMRQAVLMKPEG